MLHLYGHMVRWWLALRGMQSLCGEAAAGIIFIKYHQDYLTASHKGMVKSKVCVFVLVWNHTQTISLADGSLMWVLMEVLAAATATQLWVCLTKNWVCARVCVHVCICMCVWKYVCAESWIVFFHSPHAILWSNGCKICVCEARILWFLDLCLSMW